MTPEMRRPDRARSARRLKFLADEGAAMLVDPSTQGDGGTLFVQSASVPGVMPNFGGGGQGQGGGRPRLSPTTRTHPRSRPQIVHGRRSTTTGWSGCSSRARSSRWPSTSRSQFHDDDLMAYNTVAEIPGTDLKDEVVMLGGHMDSWHSGTGATDNAAGVSVAMEAVRILKALDLKPRRTIRIALWSGEEQGLLGSRAFVTEHFGAARPACSAAAAPAGRGERQRQRRAPTRRPSPSTTSSRPTSTSTTAPARSAASTCRATRPSGRSSASGSSRSARWAPPR